MTEPTVSRRKCVRPEGEENSGKKAYGQTFSSQLRVWRLWREKDRRTADTAPEQGKEPRQLNKEKGEWIQLPQNTGT